MLAEERLESGIPPWCERRRSAWTGASVLQPATAKENTASSCAVRFIVGSEEKVAMAYGGRGERSFEERRDLAETGHTAGRSLRSLSGRRLVARFARCQDACGLEPARFLVARQ